MLHSNEPEICVDLDSRRNLLVFCTEFNLSKTQMVTNRNDIFFSIFFTKI